MISPFSRFRPNLYRVLISPQNRSTSTSSKTATSRRGRARPSAPPATSPSRRTTPRPAASGPTPTLRCATPRPRTTRGGTTTTVIPTRRSRRELTARLRPRCRSQRRPRRPSRRPSGRSPHLRSSSSSRPLRLRRDGSSGSGSRQATSRPSSRGCPGRTPRSWRTTSLR